MDGVDGHRERRRHLRRGSHREVLARLCERIDAEREANPPPKLDLPPRARWRRPWGPLAGVAHELERGMP